MKKLNEKESLGTENKTWSAMAPVTLILVFLLAGSALVLSLKYRAFVISPPLVYLEPTVYVVTRKSHSEMTFLMHNSPDKDTLRFSAPVVYGVNNLPACFSDTAVDLYLDRFGISGYQYATSEDQTTRILHSISPLRRPVVPSLEGNKACFLAVEDGVVKNMIMVRAIRCFGSQPFVVEYYNPTELIQMFPCETHLSSNGRAIEVKNQFAYYFIRDNCFGPNLSHLLDFEDSELASNVSYYLIVSP